MPCSVPQGYQTVQRQCPVLGSSDYIASIKTIIAESPVNLTYPNVNLIGVSIQYPASTPPTHAGTNEINEGSCSFTSKLAVPSLSKVLQHNGLKTNIIPFAMLYRITEIFDLKNMWELLDKLFVIQHAYFGRSNEIVFTN
jgi:hypothetical protein